jgi:hypothetical protein
MIFGHNGNTYGGWYTPSVRNEDVNRSNNTYYGWGAGNTLSDAGVVTCNTLIGYHTGSGLSPTSSNNTAVGCESLYGYSTANGNVIVGKNNVNNNGPIITTSISGTIIIGNDLYDESTPSDGTLAVGISDPLLIGQLTGGNKYLTVQDGTFSVYQTDDAEYKISFEYDNVLKRYTNIVNVVDPRNDGSDYALNDLQYRFINDDGLSMTLWTLDPQGNVMNNAYVYQTEPNRPYAELAGDLRVRGAMRFHDGTSLSGLSYLDLADVDGVSGIDGRVSGGLSFVVLDYSDLDLAGNIANEIRTDNTFIAVQVDGTASKNHGKMSLQGIADYVSSGTSSIAENCNVLISNPENELSVNTAGNSRTVMIGCDVAASASGFHHGVIIGSEAGVNSTTSNPGFTIDTAPVFIGHRAGYGASNIENLTAIGTNAGNNSDGAVGSVFIGSSAGLNGTYVESVGIGEHALRGTASVTEVGSGNLEIVAGIDDNNRLMYQMTGLNNRFNIMNSIAGRQDRANVSIGVPRLTPVAPLEVRRDSTVHNTNGNDHIQEWYCDGVLVAYLDCNGTFVGDVARFGGGSSGGSVEGLMAEQIVGGTFSTPASGRLNVYTDGTFTGLQVWVSNRDSSITSVPTSTYVVATKIGSEYRPIWIACP